MISSAAHSSCSKERRLPSRRAAAAWRQPLLGWQTLCRKRIEGRKFIAVHSWEGRACLVRSRSKRLCHECAVWIFPVRSERRARGESEATIQAAGRFEVIHGTGL